MSSLNESVKEAKLFKITLFKSDIYVTMKNTRARIIHAGIWAERRPTAGKVTARRVYINQFNQYYYLKSDPRMHSQLLPNR